MGNVLIVDVWADDDVRGAPAINLLHAAARAAERLSNRRRPVARFPRTHRPFYQNRLDPNTRATQEFAITLIHCTCECPPPRCTCEWTQWSTGSTIAPLLAGAIGITPRSLPALYGVSAVATAASALPLLRVPPPRRQLALQRPLASADAATSSEASLDAATASEAPPLAPSTGRDRAPEVSYGAGEQMSPTRFYTVMALMFAFYACLGAAERIPGDWLTTAIVRSPTLDADEADGAFATSAFFGAHLAGRLLSVPLAWCLRPIAFCTLEFALALVSALVFVALAPSNYHWLLVSAIGIGFGIAALYPQGLLLAKSRAPLSSIWISRLVVGALLGAVAGPPLTGVLLEASPSFLYTAVVGVVVTQTLCFIAVALMPRHAPTSSLAGTTTTTEPQQPSHGAWGIEVQVVQLPPQEAVPS